MAPTSVIVGTYEAPRELEFVLEAPDAAAQGGGADVHGLAGATKMQVFGELHKLSQNAVVHGA